MRDALVAGKLADVRDALVAGYGLALREPSTRVDHEVLADAARRAASLVLVFPRIVALVALEVVA